VLLGAIAYDRGHGEVQSPRPCGGSLLRNHRVGARPRHPRGGLALATIAGKRAGRVAVVLIRSRLAGAARLADYSRAPIPPATAEKSKRRCEVHCTPDLEGPAGHAAALPSRLPVPGAAQGSQTRTRGLSTAIGSCRGIVHHFGVPLGSPHNSASQRSSCLCSCRLRSLRLVAASAEAPQFDSWSLPRRLLGTMWSVLNGLAGVYSTPQDSQRPACLVIRSLCSPCGAVAPSGCAAAFAFAP